MLHMPCLRFHGNSNIKNPKLFLEKIATSQNVLFQYHPVSPWKRCLDYYEHMSFTQTSAQTWPRPSPVGGHLAACGQRWPVGRPICVAARFTWRGCLQSVVSCGIQGDFGAGTGWDCVAVHFFLGKTNTKNICMFAAFICWSIIFLFHETKHHGSMSQEHHEKRCSQAGMVRNGGSPRKGRNM